MGCFIWLAVTNAGHRGGTVVTYRIPVYWILIVFGQMFIGASVYSLISMQLGYVIGRERSRDSGGSRTKDIFLRLIPAVIGLSALIVGTVAILRG